jgi:DMSO/TMAO reductase YedYZ heme-binding membrane subunit
MYIYAILIIFIISQWYLSKIIWEYIIKYKTIISSCLYFLSISSFLFLIWEPDIDDTGELSLEILWFILWLPILSKVFDLSIAKKIMIFRKEIWILMWAIAFVHSLQYFLQDYSYWFWEKSFWLNSFNEITYLAWWFIALIITIILTITSNTLSVKFLWRYWKKLHRLVYVLLIFTLLHVAILEIKDDWISEIFEVIIPFIIYTTFKIIEWKKIVLDKDFLINYINKKTN